MSRAIRRMRSERARRRERVAMAGLALVFGVLALAAAANMDDPPSQVGPDPITEVRP